MKSYIDNIEFSIYLLQHDQIICKHIMNKTAWTSFIHTISKLESVIKIVQV